MLHESVVPFFPSSPQRPSVSFAVLQGEMSSLLLFSRTRPTFCLDNRTCLIFEGDPRALRSSLHPRITIVEILTLESLDIPTVASIHTRLVKHDQRLSLFVGQYPDGPRMLFIRMAIPNGNRRVSVKWLVNRTKEQISQYMHENPGSQGSRTKNEDKLQGLKVVCQAMGQMDQGNSEGELPGAGRHSQAVAQCPHVDFVPDQSYVPILLYSALASVALPTPKSHGRPYELTTV